MRALTVRQPWAWALIHGGKNIENRTRNVAGSYRGPVAIHASLAIDKAGMESDLVNDAWFDAYGWGPARSGLFETGVFLGVADLVDVHRGPGECESPWAEPEMVHLVFENPRPFAYLGEHMVRAKGNLGLWTPEPLTVARIHAELERVDRLREARR